MKRTERVTVLAGGVGAARFLRGLSSLLEPRALTVIVNTGDDETFFGLHVSPDVDTIIYTLGGLVSPTQGWGIDRDTFRCLQALQGYYEDTWFQLGDRDLATHIYRTDALLRGKTLSRVTGAIAAAHGVRQKVLPMSDAAVRTFVRVAGRGPLPFQEYLVHRRGRGTVQSITPRGAEQALPAPGVVRAIQQARYVILPPSNPFVSIGPILALRGVRTALQRTKARIAAISPIVAGAPIKGPLHRMLRGMGHEVSPLGVARLYKDFADFFVLDRRDRHFADRIAKLGMQPLVTDTIMSTPAKSLRLAGAVLQALES